jgi:hypothetical protein
MPMFGRLKRDADLICARSRASIAEAEFSTHIR